ncbi:uncharacterized protein N0V89_004878 [Didymosphaeria variabile]|uniref:Uncharacterized protein n=1 Tax=Didymosphaeria variabile TaxID=1932322 RepID=A0A9W8XSN8_9PLEO|nr:uncharacterized protein N0V89_004878 [Didymosphaeria variabile]KAJ4356841.1 hypothetical protein N0V89_004878 [Didymosphaeria variabile]
MCLPERPIFVPDAHGAHIDGGNTRTDDWVGPLGNNPQVFGSSTLSAYMFWEEATKDSHVLVSLACSSDPVYFCLAALDSETLKPIAQWSAPNHHAVSIYWQVVDGRVTIPTQEGFIVDLEFVKGTDGTGSFNLVREIDLSNIMTQNSIIAIVGYTGDGNLWFSTTPVPLLGLDGPNTTTVGYVQTDNTVHTILLQDEIVENGMAINNNAVYLVTGPAGKKNHADASGGFYAFLAGTDGITTAYNETYSAGSGMKAGGLSRGSGSTVSLIGQKYVAITDNADTQINLVVYHQVEELPEGKPAQVCSHPLFEPNASANEACLTTYSDDNKYTAVIPNGYNSPWSFGGESEINGPQNNLSVMAPGATRIDISDDGTCSFVWDLPVRVTMSTLSTGSGLFYIYTQDYELANQGEYVWYVVAYEFQSGEEVWRAKMGSGGVYNTGISAIQLGPNGRIYEGIDGGVAWMQDSA